MSDASKNNFHEFSLKSALFKGRSDLYFCYLKSEKIAHAFAHLLGGSMSEEHSIPDTIARASAHLPSSIVRFAADELEESSVLVDIFELLSLTRLAVSHGLLEAANAAIIVAEYEGIAEKISLGKNASPFLSLEDLAVPPFASMPEQGQGRPALGSQSPFAQRENIKDKKVFHKGQTLLEPVSKEQGERASAILKIVTDKKKVSIKDISKVIKNCSEKTIQRELNVLIQQGLVLKEGERRWSLYKPAQ